MDWTCSIIWILVLLSINGYFEKFLYITLMTSALICRLLTQNKLRHYLQSSHIHELGLNFAGAKPRLILIY